ncbi:unnamed protein product [Meganyctiphanes norvegica]|uniref:Membrane protein BRI3 n=1 Tax=Meganyctiphanes norvegica TaxID=48144 RepID=A0AAV2Q5E0_MEGNR
MFLSSNGGTTMLECLDPDCTSPEHRMCASLTVPSVKLKAQYPMGQNLAMTEISEVKSLTAFDSERPVLQNRRRDSKEELMAAGICTTCKVGYLDRKLTLPGILSGIFMFPVGIWCLLAFRDKFCPKCDAHYPWTSTGNAIYT